MHTPRTLRAAGLATAALSLAFAAGCSKDKKSSSSASKAIEAKTVDVGAINNTVPGDLKSSLSFEAATIDDGELSAVVPSGWKASKYIPGSYRPGSGSKLGFMTSFKVGANCDGECKPKPYENIARKVEFARFENTKRFEIAKDEKLDNGRILVASAGNRTYVVSAWWKKGAREYIYCRATLDREAAKAVDAFEQACRSTRHNKW